MMMMAMAAAAAIISFSFLLSLRPSVVVQWSTLRCAGGAPPPSFLFAQYHEARSKEWNGMQMRREKEAARCLCLAAGGPPSERASEGRKRGRGRENNCLGA